MKTKSLGHETIIMHLTELIYVEILRRYIKNIPASGKNWLVGLADPNIGRALKCIHQNPDEKWNVTTLAQEARMSRSAFAGLFKELTDESPMQYVTSWCMQIAKYLLLENEADIIQIAERTGYGSAAAFTQAFTKNEGIPPANWQNKAINRNG